MDLFFYQAWVGYIIWGELESSLGACSPDDLPRSQQGGFSGGVGKQERRALKGTSHGQLWWEAGAPRMGRIALAPLQVIRRTLGRGDF